MIKLSLNYLRKNPKQTLTIFLGIILASMTLFSVGILFSSFREYLISKVTKESDYHVKIQGDLNGYHDKKIKSLKYLDSFYFIKFENIYETFDLTENICDKKECLNIVYNNELLSLYGIGDNNYIDLFKELIFAIVFVLAISVFFIIYNSFQISFSKRRRDTILLKAIGISDNQLYKIFLFESVVYLFLGIFLGFGLSILLNYGIINVINNLLSEVLGSNIVLSLYAPFIFIPLAFVILIVLLSSLLPLLKIKKYKIMELFRNNNENINCISKIKNPLLNFAYINYERNKKKYRGLILCVFIIIILFNMFLRLTDYTIKILDEYVSMPKYDVRIFSNMSDYSKLDDLVSYLSASDKNIFRSCEKVVTISKDNYNRGYKDNMGVLVTDLGGNSVINLVNDTLSQGEKMTKVNYRIFNKLNEITLSNGVMINDINLTEDVPFGFENELIQGRIILNLNKDKFDEVCPVYSGNALIKTNVNKIDDKVLKYFRKNNFGDVSYTNVKKVYEIMNNFVLIIKLFTIFCVGIVSLISVFTICNIVSANIKFRRREFATLKVLGFTNFKIGLCLLFECLIICGKGALYSFPFILLISNFLYKNLGMFFEINVKVFNYELFILSFVICFLIIFICMFFSHLNLYKNTLISNIKCDNI